MEGGGMRGLHARIGIGIGPDGEDLVRRMPGIRASPPTHPAHGIAVPPPRHNNHPLGCHLCARRPGSNSSTVGDSVRLSHPLQSVPPPTLTPAAPTLQVHSRD